jgi:TetR/AcrR family transcriptional regulator
MPASGVATQDRILQEALALFARKGYDATSVREICEAAQITKPTLYHFYQSKEGVYQALVGGALDDFSRTVKAIVARRGEARERLCAVAGAYFAFARESPALTRFLFGLVHNPPSSAPLTDFPSFYEEITSQVSTIVSDGEAAGELASGSLECRMLLFMGALGEAVCGFLFTGRPALSAGLAEALVDTLMDGWRVRA